MIGIIATITCGGLAITVCSSHGIADMSSTMSFVTAWSIAAKQELGYVDDVQYLIQNH